MKATTGGIIIEAGQAQKKVEGGIIIPEKARQRRSSIGKVVSVTPYPVGTTVKMWQGGAQGGKKKVIISQARYDESMSLMGRCVLLEEGQEFPGEDKKMYVRGKIEHAIAIVPEPDKMKLVADGPARCPRCKSRGESNLLLDDKGYCPNCERNPAGQHKDDYSISVSDDLSDHMAGRTNRDAQRKRDGVSEHGKVMSYAGQKHRSSLRTKK